MRDALNNKGIELKLSLIQMFNWNRQSFQPWSRPQSRHHHESLHTA